MHSDSQNDRKIIFQLTIAYKDNEELQFLVRKVYFAAYTLIIQYKIINLAKKTLMG